VNAASGVSGRVAHACAQWDLEPDPARVHWTDDTTLVVPVRPRGCAATGSAREQADLHVCEPPGDREQRHLALRAWAGRGAARLLAADPAASLLLVEPLLVQEPLSNRPEDEACAVLGGLLRTLPVPAPGWARSASQATEAAWEDLSPAAHRLPRRFVAQARALTRVLLAGPEVDAALIPVGLRAHRVFARAHFDGTWVAAPAIPLAGEPAYAVWPALWPATGFLDDDGTPPAHLAGRVQARLGWVCHAAGIEEERARAWAIVRTVLEGPRRAGALGTAEPPDARTTVTLLKALQPP
jgi:streptomycin 6-kinase